MPSSVLKPRKDFVEAEADDESLASNAEKTKKNVPLVFSIVGVVVFVVVVDVVAAAAVGVVLVAMVDSNRFDSIEFLNLRKRKSYKFLSRGIKDYFYYLTTSSSHHENISKKTVVMLHRV
jgi:hypothetical protein